MNLRASIFIFIALCGCRSLDKKIIQMSDSEKPALASFQNASVIAPPPAATIRILPTAVELLWDGTDGFTYNVYWGTSSHSYSQLVNAGTNSFAIVNGLEKGRAYYFAITAADGSGVESDLSTELKAVPPTILEIAFNPPGASLQSSIDLVTWSNRAAMQLPTSVWHVTMNAALKQEFFRASN